LCAYHVLHKERGRGRGTWTGGLCCDGFAIGLGARVKRGGGGGKRKELSVVHGDDSEVGERGGKGVDNIWNVHLSVLRGEKKGT